MYNASIHRNKIEKILAFLRNILFEQLNCIGGNFIGAGIGRKTD
jgi:hypothetical protein